jgi:hypothetical protein
MAGGVYGRVAPLFRDLERGLRETEDERLAKLRYPPTGDPAVWVRTGPDATSLARNWDGLRMRDHEHVAGAPGADCGACGFPWWPDAQDGA